MNKKRRRKITACIVFAGLLCLFVFIAVLSFAVLRQQGDVIVYRGVKYEIAYKTDFIAYVDLDGYRKIGYAKLNLFPYIAVYAPPVENPDHLVFDGGRRICFAEGEYPDELTTEYLKILAENSEGFQIEYTDAMDLSKEVSPVPNAYPEFDPSSDVYSLIVRLTCYLPAPNNTYRTIKVFENNGIYYIRDFGDDRDATDYERYYAVIEGSCLHTLILETIAAGQSSR